MPNPRIDRPGSQYQSQAPTPTLPSEVPQPDQDTTGAHKSRSVKSVDRTANTEEPQNLWSGGVLNPLNWFASKPKSLADRDVRDISNQPGLVDRHVIFRIINHFISRYIKGLGRDDLSGTLKKLSATYHKGRTGQPFEPEVIHLKQLTLTSGIPIKDVRLTLHQVQATGADESDPFKQLTLKASLSGKADVPLDDEKTVEADVNLNSVELTLDFQNGYMLGRLIESGSIFSNLTSLLWNRNTLANDLTPTNITCQLRDASLQTGLTGSDEGQTSVVINSADINLCHPHPTALQVQVRNLDADIKSHKLKPILPKEWRQFMTEILPHSVLGKNEIHLKTEQLDYNKQGSEKRTHCPALHLETSGDITLKNGKVNGLTVATGNNQAAVSFQQVQGDLLIHQATLKQPYDLKGAIDAHKGIFYLKDDPKSRHPNFAFKIKKLDTDLNGGLKLKSQIEGLNGLVSTSTNTTAVHIPTIKAEKFAIGTDPSRVTEHNRLLDGHFTGHDVSIHTAPGDNQKENSITFNATTLHGEKVQFNKQYLPEGVQYSCDLQIENASYTAQRVKASGQADKCRIKTDLHIEARQTAAVTEQLRQQIHQLKQHLPEQKELDDLIVTLDQQEEPVETDKPMTQTVTLTTGMASYEGKINKQGVKSTILKAAQTDLDLDKGVLEGRATLKNLEIDHAQKKVHTTLDVFVEKLDSTVKTNEESQLPVSFALTAPATASNIQLSRESDGGKSKTHLQIDKASIVADIGLTGLQKEGSPQPTYKPLHLGTRVSNLQIDTQLDAHQKLRTLAIGQTDLRLTNTEEQFGSQLDVEVTSEKVLLVDRHTPQNRQTTHVFNAELGSGHIATQGAINGSAHVSKAGLTVASNPYEIKINPRYDSKGVTANFPNGAKEVLNIIQNETLKKSALGQLIELDAKPELDANLTGKLSLYAGGALKHPLTLAIDSIDNRIAKGALKVVRLLMSVLNFQIRLDNLPITQGTTTVPDMIRCLSISFSSDSIPLRPYAGFYQSIAARLQGPLVRKLIRKTGLVEEGTDEISLKRVAAMVKNDIHIVTAEELPALQIPRTGDALTDISHLIQRGEQLPDSWNETQYTASILTRLQKIRVHNQSLQQADGTDQAQLQQLSDQIIKDYPLPTTMTGLNTIERLLSALQRELQAEAETLSVDIAYQRVHPIQPSADIY